MIFLLIGVLNLVFLVQILWFQIKILSLIERKPVNKHSNKTINVLVTKSDWDLYPYELSLKFNPLPTKTEWDLLSYWLEEDGKIIVDPYNRFETEYRFSLHKDILLDEIIEVLQTGLTPIGWQLYVCKRFDN